LAKNIKLIPIAFFILEYVRKGKKKFIYPPNEKEIKANETVWNRVKIHDKNPLTLAFMNLLCIFETSNILKAKEKRTNS